MHRIPGLMTPRLSFYEFREYCKFSIFQNLEFSYSAHKKSVSGQRVYFCEDCKSDLNKGISFIQVNQGLVFTTTTQAAYVAVDQNICWKYPHNCMSGLTFCTWIKLVKRHYARNPGGLRNHYVAFLQNMHAMG